MGLRFSGCEKRCCRIFLKSCKIYGVVVNSSYFQPRFHVFRVLLSQAPLVDSAGKTCLLTCLRIDEGNLSLSVAIKSLSLEYGQKAREIGTQKKDKKSLDRRV